MRRQDKISGLGETAPTAVFCVYAARPEPSGQVKKVGTEPERHLARLQAELRATDKRHQDAMITKETTEFIVKRITKVIDRERKLWKR